MDVVLDDRSTAITFTSLPFTHLMCPIPYLLTPPCCLQLLLSTPSYCQRKSHPVAVNVQVDMPRAHAASVSMVHLSLNSNAFTVQKPTSKGSMAPTAAVSRFENLPRELRNAIYNELWQHSPVLNVMFRGIRVQFPVPRCSSR